MLANVTIGAHPPIPPGLMVRIRTKCLAETWPQAAEIVDAGSSRRRRVQMIRPASVARPSSRTGSTTPGSPGIGNQSIRVPCTRRTASHAPRESDGVIIGHNAAAINFAVHSLSLGLCGIAASREGSGAWHIRRRHRRSRPHPRRARNGGLSTIHPADLLATVQKALDRAHPASTRPRSARSSAAASARSASRRSTSPAPRGSPPACRSRSPPPPSTPSAARRSRPPTWPPASSAPAWSTSPSPAASRSMSRVPIGSNSAARRSASASRSRRRYFAQYEFTSQFEGAERIADKWGITRERRRRVRPRGPSSAPPRRGPRTASPPRSSPVDAPDLDEEGKPTGTTHTRQPRRGPARDHAREAGRRSSPSPARTASTPPATSSQISDGAAAVLHDDRREGRRARAHAAGPRRRHLPRRRRPGAHAHRPDRRHPAAARAHRPDDRRHRRRRDQRGVRLGGAGLGQGARRRHRARSTPTAAPSPSATRSAAPAPS